MNLNAFEDELQKISAAVPDRLMRKVLMSLNPHYTRAKTLLKLPTDKAELVRTYREALRTGGKEGMRGSVEIPLAKRLEVYKHWKRTGSVPALKARGKDVEVFTNPSDFNIHRPLKYERSSEPISLTSFGGDKGLQGSLSRGRSMLDREYLIPGSTRSHRYGLYAYPTKLTEGGRGTAYAEAGVGAPARMDFTIPRKDVLQSELVRPEVLIPEFNMRRVLQHRITKL